MCDNMKLDKNKRIIVRYDRKAGLYAPFIVKGDYAYSLYTGTKIKIKRKRR